MLSNLTTLFGGGLGLGGGPSGADSLGAAHGGQSTTSVKFGSVSGGLSSLQILVVGATVAGAYFLFFRKRK